MKINNKTLGVIYDKPDFILRCLYCNIPFLNRLLFWKLYTSNFSLLDSKFSEMMKIIRKKGFNLDSKICLELGPGNSYMNAYNLLLNGARKVILLDKFSRNLKSDKQKEFFQKELEFTRKKYGKKQLFFIKKGKINEKYIEFVEGDLTKINFKEKIDFVLTVSVLEHVKNIEQVICELSRIMKKGALMYHQIDLRDHYNFNNPFLFYKYSKKTWERFLTKEGVSYTNRVRSGEFIELFKKHGFMTLLAEKETFAINNKRVNREFKNKKDLNVGILRVLAKKVSENEN